MLKVQDERRLRTVPRAGVGIRTRTLPRTQATGWDWKYNPAEYGSRDLRLDLLRGFCLFVMLIDHIGVFGPDSWLYAISARGEFYISAAEGFVFISGLVMGMVYLRVIQKEGFKKAASKIYQRTIKIYWLAVALTLFFVALAKFTTLSLWAEREWITINDPVELILSTLTLRFSFHGASILVMYVIFLAAAPFVLYLLNSGKTKQLLIGSVVLWASNVFYPQQFTTPFSSNFPLASWQLLFVGGLAIGFHRQAITEFFARWKWSGYYFVGIGAAAVFLVTFHIAEVNKWLDNIFPGVPLKFVLLELHNKGSLPLFRMLAIAIMLQALYLLLTWAWKPIDRALGWLLIPIGEVALYSFAMHLVIIVLFYNIPGVRDLPYLFYGFALASSVIVLWAMVKNKFLFKVVPQ
jgi:hypothetical protein